MNARQPVGFLATGDRATGDTAIASRAAAEAAAINAALCKLGPQGGLRLQDFTEAVQRAVTPEDIDDAFGLEWERFEDRLTHGPALNPQEQVQFDLIERIYVLACLRVEGRGEHS